MHYSRELQDQMTEFAVILRQTVMIQAKGVENLTSTLQDSKAEMMNLISKGENFSVQLESIESLADQMYNFPLISRRHLKKVLKTLETLA